MYPYKYRPIRPVMKLQYIVSALDVVRPKDHYFPGEMHDFWEMVFIADGEACLTSDHRVYHLKKGDLVLHRPMAFHRIWSCNDTSPHLKIVSFVAEGEGMEDVAERAFSLDEASCEKVDQINSLFKYVIRLSKTEDGDPLEYDYYSQKAALLLESFLLELYERRMQKSAYSDRSGKLYERIVRVMNEHCRQSLTMEQIAQLCGISVSNLKRVFHIYSDIGVMKYFTSIKLRCARKELLGDKTIGQISDELGFSSPSYFHTVFKRELGMTPKAYIKSNK